MNHTVRLINANAVDGIKEVIDDNKWVDSIITRFNMDYFYEDTLEETFDCVVKCMKAVLVSDGTVYIEVPLKYIPIVSYLFTKNCFVLQNIITIPANPVKCCHPKKYIDNNKYILFFTHKEYPARYMNPVEHDENTCMCQFSSNWSWFEGSDIDAYRMMMRISTDPHQVILDPFMNEGDIGVAAILQDREFIGIECGRARLDDTYMRLADLGE